MLTPGLQATSTVGSTSLTILLLNDELITHHHLPFLQCDHSGVEAVQPPHWDRAPKAMVEIAAHITEAFVGNQIMSPTSSGRMLGTIGPWPTTLHTPHSSLCNHKEKEEVGELPQILINLSNAPHLGC